MQSCLTRKKMLWVLSYECVWHFNTCSYVCRACSRRRAMYVERAADDELCM